MSKIERYIQAATRENTRRSYQAAVEHFEVQWGGMLPATADQIARYLADYADSLSHNTLKLRLAALGQWHQAQGFVDPTKAPMVKKVLKGIRELHPARTKQAKPLQLNELEQACIWLDQSFNEAKQKQHHGDLLRASRNKALLLIGFWRGFRSDELSRLDIENIEVTAGQGMIIYLPRSKTDRTSQGQEYRAPALARLCPVQAYQNWLQCSELSEGPVFRRINRWGHLAKEALNSTSVLPLLRKLLAQAGVIDHNHYSSHSLRRGFATWAGQQGWSVKNLMEYVGWQDVNSATRYIESLDPFEHTKFDTLKQEMLKALPKPQYLNIDMRIVRFHDKAPSKKKTREKLERFGLSPVGAMLKRIDEHHYQLQLPDTHEQDLDELADELLERLHSIAADNQCLIEVTISDPNSRQLWE